MNIFNIIILSILFPFALSEDIRSCDFKEPSSAIKSVSKIVDPSRDLLNKFIKEDFSDMFDIDLVKYGIDFNEVIYSAASFGSIFALFFVILLIYFIVFCCCNCCCGCCCRAKSAKKPNVILIIFHYLSIVLLIISAIFLFISSTNTLKALSSIKTFPKNINQEITNVFDTFDSTLTDTFEVISTNVDNFINNLTDFAEWLKTSNVNSSQAAQGVIPKIKEYDTIFGDVSKEYMKLYNELLSSVESNNLRQSVILMNASRENAINTIIELAQRLISANEDIKETSDNMNEIIDDNIKSIKETIGDFQNETLTEEIDEMRSNINESFLDLDIVEDICDVAYTPAKIALYVISIFVLLVAILYAAIFFCHNCCSRCVACCFPCFGIILNIVVILPCLIFAILFVVFNDLCPQFENAIDGLVNSDSNDDNDNNDDIGNRTLIYNYLFPNRNSYKFSNALTLESDGFIKDAKELLLCPNDTPLLDLINIDGFDPNDILKDFSDNIGSKEIDLKIPVEGSLSDYADNFNVDENISSNYILFHHNETLNEVESSLPSAKDTARKMKNIIESKEADLEEIRGFMRTVISFGSAVVPRAEELKNQTDNIYDLIISDANSTINDGFNSITCKSFKCVYSPFKNMLCYDLLNGMAFWIMSGIILFVGLLILSITICLRRRQMKKPKLQNNSSSDSSMNEFNS